MEISDNISRCGISYDPNCWFAYNKTYENDYKTKWLMQRALPSPNTFPNLAYREQSIVKKLDVKSKLTAC